MAPILGIIQHDEQKRKDDQHIDCLQRHILQQLAVTYNKQPVILYIDRLSAGGDKREASGYVHHCQRNDECRHIDLCNEESVNQADHSSDQDACEKRRYQAPAGSGHQGHRHYA